MADFNSLEKQIDTLARAMADGFDGVNNRLEKLEENAEIANERLEKLEGNAEIVNQKLERIERNQPTQSENHILLETRVAKLENPVS